MEDSSMSWLDSAVGDRILNPTAFGEVEEDGGEL